MLSPRGLPSSTRSSVLRGRNPPLRSHARHGYASSHRENTTSDCRTSRRWLRSGASATRPIGPDRGGTRKPSTARACHSPDRSLQHAGGDTTRSVLVLRDIIAHQHHHGSLLNNGGVAVNVTPDMAGEHDCLGLQKDAHVHLLPASEKKNGSRFRNREILLVDLLEVDDG